MKPRHSASPWFITGFLISLLAQPANAEDLPLIYLTPGFQRDLQFDNAESRRSYDLFVPPLRTETHRPLVVLLHDFAASADQISGAHGLETPYSVWFDIARREQVFLLIPDGLPNADGQRAWNDCRRDAPATPDSADLTFILGAIAETANRYRIDTGRLYATGTGNGGQMALRLAMEASETFAAVAAVNASMARKNQCRFPTEPISVLFMSGTEDPVWPFRGGPVAPTDALSHGRVLPVMESALWWVHHNQTRRKPVETRYPALSRDDGSTVRQFRFSGGLFHTEVILYEIAGGGHPEPSLTKRYPKFLLEKSGSQNGDIEMAEEIWLFFKNHHRNERTLNIQPPTQPLRGSTSPGGLTRISHQPSAAVA